MSEQAPLDATFFAFKKRDRAFVLTASSVAYYLLAALVTVVFVALSWGAWSALITWYLSAAATMSNGGTPEPPEPQLMLSIAPYALASLPISIVLFAAFEAACLRWLVRGEAGGGLFGLKLDADTFRVLGVYVFWFLFFVALLVAVGVFYAAVVALGSVGGIAQIVAMLLGALAPIGCLAVLVWGAVLFAPAAATSVGRKKLTFFSARKVSSPRYWPLFTSYLLIIVGYVLVASIVSAIVQIPLNSAMAPLMASIMNGADAPQVMSLLLETFTTPTMIAILVANIVVSFVLATLYYIAMFGVNARAFEAAAEAGDVERG